LTAIYEYPGATDPETYELENLSADPDGLIEAHMERIAPMAGAVLLDIGAGSGFHAARFARVAATVYAVEPDPNMRTQFGLRFAREPHANVELLAAHAEEIPLPDESVDIAHARFAYFFGTLGKCDRGIEEVKRLLKPGGHFFIIDNCYGRGQFAAFCELADGHGAETQRANEEFYARRGFDVTMIDSCWRAPSREALDRIMRMEFPERCVNEIMRRISGSELSYCYSVYHHRKP